MSKHSSGTDDPLIYSERVHEVVISTSFDADNAKLMVLAETRAIAAVTNQEQSNQASLVLRDAKAFLKSVEAARVAAKAPLLEKGKAIDALAKELTAELEMQANRISKLIGAFQAEQARIAEEARQKAYQEEQRIRAEAARMAAERERALQAEQAALQAKADRARSDAKAAEYQAISEAKAALAAKEQQARDEAAQQAIIATRQSAAALAPVKPSGIATREEVKFEVTDIVKLYEAAPYLVNLTANTAAIKNAVKNLAAGQSLPGVRHWKEAVAVVR